ncbi:DUF317 domain-containing protein [Kitasatospora sp. A2-31]|uniref:DUF317 domain-containing protein n=1 Tax=Kitasatospora sp. A2-31 TaxID=2916414 RepID=UPI001EEC4CB7|nr:DUF317 domain-containing protein [Kitasatospora sp. A2-31]MCG6496999.1 DUF317 domain-containing protein [Kitasatospora sp. A2-31]
MPFRRSYRTGHQYRSRGRARGRRPPGPPTLLPRFRAGAGPPKAPPPIRTETHLTSTTQAAATEIDGDTHVHPVYLAGSRYTGDFALQPLLDLPDTRAHNDEHGNFYLTTADGRIRIGFIPEQDWDTLWQLAVAPGPFADPHWVASFSDDTPTEIVAAVTTQLADLYRPGEDAWFTERTAGPLEWIAPYAAAGWTAHEVDTGQLTLHSPDTLAKVTYSLHALAREDAEQAGQDGRYTIGTVSRAGWYGRFSSGTPSRILDAASAAMLDPAPIPRYRSELGPFSRRTASITPITPPAPTPADLQRAAAARARTAPRILQAAPAGTGTRLAWTTTTPGPRRR